MAVKGSGDCRFEWIGPQPRLSLTGARDEHFGPVRLYSVECLVDERSQVGVPTDQPSTTNGSGFGLRPVNWSSDYADFPQPFASNANAIVRESPRGIVKAEALSDAADNHSGDAVVESVEGLGCHRPGGNSDGVEEVAAG